MSEPAKPVKIALFGPGTVGTQVVRLLTEQRRTSSNASARPSRSSGIYVRDTARAARRGDRPGAADVRRACAHRGCGPGGRAHGRHRAGQALMLESIGAGAAVVTANKALLAAHGPELFEAADAANVDLYFEAAVAGAIPIIRPVRESLAGDHVKRILGIVNGTTNYVLDEMTTRALDYDVAVKQAQDLGYAEADPTADVEGHDAAAKAAILASLAFHQRVHARRRLLRGHLRDHGRRRRRGHRVGPRHQAAGHRRSAPSDGGHRARCIPRSCRSTTRSRASTAPSTPSSSRPRPPGELMFYGQGAGGTPTASAVLGRHRLRRAPHRPGRQGPARVALRATSRCCPSTRRRRASSCA